MHLNEAANAVKEEMTGIGVFSQKLKRARKEDDWSLGKKMKRERKKKKKEAHPG